MVWRRWFEAATYMIDGVFDHLPVTVAVHDGFDGDFLLLDFDEVQGIGYLEYPTGAIYIQDQDQVGACTLSAGRLCAAALSESIPPMPSSHASRP
jgi:Domain of unknown function (DUF5753)